MSDLIVLLHGRGATEEDLLPLAPLVAPGAEVLAPRAPHRVGPGYGWAPEEADVLGGDGLERAAEALDERIGSASAGRVVLLGFSQGGAVAVELLRRAPERYARTVLLSSFLRAPESEDTGVAAVRPAVFWGRGAADPRFGAGTIAGTARWLGANTALTARVYPDLAHAVSEAELLDVAAFLAP